MTPSLRIGLVIAVSSTAFAACANAPSSSPSIVMPARFEADRVFLDVAVPGRADPLVLFTDTGGGLFLFGVAADRTGVPDSVGLVLSTLSPSGIPDPRGAPDGVVPVYRPDPDDESDPEFDGMLGQAWFADRVWNLDYASERLSLLLASPPIDAPGKRVPLWFKTDSAGTRLLSFPRIQVTVDGVVLDMLLDTGASLALTESAASEIGDGGPRMRATSFITTATLRQWRERHPEWRIVENADHSVSGMRLIQVPAVEVAGHVVGPVWFTERPNRNFQEYMAQWMDRPVDGAVGGNVFRFFSMTIDYPSGAALFVRAGSK